ncbi:hypothetical protein [Actinoallomurus acanthiterrae]
MPADPGADQGHRRIRPDAFGAKSGKDDVVIDLKSVGDEAVELGVLAVQLAAHRGSLEYDVAPGPYRPEDDVAAYAGAFAVERRCLGGVEHGPLAVQVATDLGGQQTHRSAAVPSRDEGAPRFRLPEQDVPADPHAIGEQTGVTVSADRGSGQVELAFDRRADEPEFPLTMDFLSVDPFLDLNTVRSQVADARALEDETGELGSLQAERAGQFAADQMKPDRQGHIDQIEIAGEVRAGDLDPARIGLVLVESQE